MDRKRKERYKNNLLKKRESIINISQGRAEEEEESSSSVLDNGDRARSSYVKELHFQINAAEQKILDLIEEALHKIKTKGYGRCVECEKPIQEPRLNAIPWARHCIQCQELQERGLIS